jgi:AcrR family transcriptional regulator
MDISKDEEVKNAILAAAKRVFQKWGLNKTTMEDIAHEAGKGKSTLYYYFKSKDEIFDMLIEAEMNNIFAITKQFIDSIISPKEKLKKYIAITITELKKTVSIFPLITGEIKGNIELIERMKKRIDKREEMIVREILKLGLDAGEFTFLKEENLDKAANVIVGIIRGLEMYLFLENNDDEKIDIATRLITEGV